MSKMNPAILEGIKKINRESQERQMKAKSCGGGDVNFLQHPNLERKRVATDMINLVRDTSVLLSMVSQRDMECSGKIPRLDSCRIVSSGECNTECGGNGFNFNTSYIPFELVKRSAQFDVPRDFLHCNELGEPEAIMDEMMAMMLTNIQNEMEMAFIYGDDTLPTGSGHPAMNNLLALNDGILKLASVMAPVGQIIDAMGAGPSPDLFAAAKTALPSRYRAERNEYSFLVGPEIKDWYSRYLAKSPTDAGDAALRNGEAARLWGNNLVEIPMWREDFEYGTAPETIDVTHILFIRMSNPIYIMGRRPVMMSDYKLECDKTLYKQYWEDDAVLQYPEEVVLIKNVAPCGIPWEGCPTTNYCCYPTGTVPNPVQCD